MEAFFIQVGNEDLITEKEPGALCQFESSVAIVFALSSTLSGLFLRKLDRDEANLELVFPADSQGSIEKAAATQQLDWIEFLVVHLS